MAHRPDRDLQASLFERVDAHDLCHFGEDALEVAVEQVTTIGNPDLRPPVQIASGKPRASTAL
jgi:hypothetical protein